VLVAFFPVILCLVIIVSLFLWGKSKLLAPADLYPFDNISPTATFGTQIVGSEGISVMRDWCKATGASDADKLRDFHTANHGAHFRLRKRPTVGPALVTNVSLTVLAVDDKVPILKIGTEAPAACAPNAEEIEPERWVIEIPQDVCVGMTIPANRIGRREASDTGKLTDEITSNRLLLPDQISQPFIVKITGSKECFVRYRLDVHVDAGMRSSDIEVCNEVPVAFYMKGSPNVRMLKAPSAPQKVPEQSAPLPVAPKADPSA
jgi:hypothetical protein